MEYVLIFVGCFAVLLWFINGLLNSQSARMDRELQDYYDSFEDTSEADDLLRDPDHIKRLRDTFND